jgi:arylsulfatase A-like enzyme
MEPHTPYNPPGEYDRYRTEDDFPNLSDANSRDGLKLRNLAALGNAHAIKRLSQLYAGKILYIDHYLGELFKTVADLGLDQNTIIILLSDHGQLLYSHPEDFNTDDHRSQYDADLWIPLMFWGPGIQSGRRVDAMVSQYDILPTILDLEGVSVPQAMDGTSLKPILLGQQRDVHSYVLRGGNGY